MRSLGSITTDPSKRRVIVSALILLQLHIIHHTSPVECINHNSSRSNHRYGTNDGSSRFYANHRMFFREDDRKGSHHRTSANNSEHSSTLVQIDHMAAASMPRPQLALQIYTSSPPSNHRSDQPQQPSNITSNNYQQPARLLNTMLLMPISSVLRDQRTPPESNLETTSGAPSASQRDYMIDLSSSRGKSSQWHYVTESQQPALTASEMSSAKDRSTSADADNGGASSSTNNSPGSPLINAIITVPSPSEHHHHHHHQDHDGHLSQQSSSIDNSSAAQIVDRTIAQLLDGQATGNIEFSMDLNGEEIVINPVRKHGRSMDLAPNSTRDLLLNRIKFDASSSHSDEDNSLQMALNGRRMKNFLESENHHHSTSPFSSSNRRQSSQSRDPVENQQSASEIDLVDEGNDDGESGFDGESLIESSSKSTRKTSLHTKEADRDQDKLDDERSTNDGYSDDENGEDRPNSSETLSEDKTRQLDSDSIRLRKSKSSRSRTSGISKKQGRDSQFAVGKLALSSRRRVALKSDDSLDDQQLAMNRRDVKQAAASPSSKDLSLSAVMIKGEDLRRLEQLLQSLRSASLADQSSQKVKGRSSSFQGQRRDYLADDGSKAGNFKREETESRTTHQAEGDSWSEQDKNRQQVPNSQTNIKTDKNELITLSDCQRRRQEKQWRKVSTNDDDNGSYEPDSPQELASETISDESNEKEEQGSDNYNSVSLPVKDQEDRERPRSMFVRKTILHSYYGDNTGQPLDEGQMERDSSPVGLNDELMASKEQRVELVTSQMRPQPIGGYPSSPDGRLSRGQDSTRSENYIDYSKLDDRDVYGRFQSAVGNRTHEAHH